MCSDADSAEDGGVGDAAAPTAVFGRLLRLLSSPTGLKYEFEFGRVEIKWLV